MVGAAAWQQYSFGAVLLVKRGRPESHASSSPIRAAISLSILNSSAWVRRESGLNRIGAAAKLSPSETRTEPMSLW